MSLHYLLDGYNIIHQNQAFAHKEIDAQRDALIRFIAIRCPQGSSKNKVTIVFDGKPGRSIPASTDRIEIIFSQSISADDKIRKIVAQSRAAAKLMVVVTDDRAIQYSVRSDGAKALSVQEFLGQAKSSEPAPEQAAETKRDKKYIPLTVERKINEELERIWLKSDRGKKP